MAVAYMNVGKITDGGKETGTGGTVEELREQIIAVALDDGDYLIGVAITDGGYDVMLFSDAGKAVRFEEGDARPMGRNARGVRGMMLDDGQSVIAMLVAEDEAAEREKSESTRTSVLTATEKQMPCAPMMTAVLTPITSPSRLNNGPPELPRLMAASVWI